MRGAYNAPKWPIRSSSLVSRRRDNAGTAPDVGVAVGSHEDVEAGHDPEETTRLPGGCDDPGARTAPQPALGGSTAPVAQRRRGAVAARERPGVRYVEHVGDTVAPQNVRGDDKRRERVADEQRDIGVGASAAQGPPRPRLERVDEPSRTDLDQRPVANPMPQRAARRPTPAAPITRTSAREERAAATAWVRAPRGVRASAA